VCGKIGGGTNAYTDYASATLSEWYNACSSNGANAYPYVGAYQPTTCNGDDFGASASAYTTTVVASLTGCQAPVPYSGVYDLSGNVSEWEDSCDTTRQSGNCLIRGGAFNYSGSYLTCGYANILPPQLRKQRRRVSLLLPLKTPQVEACSKRTGACPMAGFPIHAESRHGPALGAAAPVVHRVVIAWPLVPTLSLGVFPPFARM